MLSEAQGVSLRITSGVRVSMCFVSGKVWPIAKGVGLRVANSHSCNHPEDGFTPLETIRRLLVAIGRRSYLGFEGDNFKPERRLDKFVADVAAPIEALLLKKPPVLQNPAPSRT
ncbi:hypothetical protein Tco_0879284 [Tanacetum coccineum]